MLRAFQFGLILLMLAALTMISAIVTMHFAIHGAEVTVPDFKGLTVAEATTKAASLGLNLSVDNHYYSIEVPAGHIAGQSPLSGTLVRRAWHVRLIESLGPQRIAVPDLEGLDQRVASIQVRRDALQIGVTAQIPWAFAPDDTVIAQSPAPGAASVARPYVSMLVATPPAVPNRAYVMPNLTGQMFSAAALAVTHAGLKLAPPKPAPEPVPTVAGAPSTQPAPPVIPPGTVVSQSPEPGQPVDASMTVELTVEQ
jgi:beta-lactam-binding protein with PASTA domain